MSTTGQDRTTTGGPFRARGEQRPSLNAFHLLVLSLAVLAMTAITAAAAPETRPVAPETTPVSEPPPPTPGPVPGTTERPTPAVPSRRNFNIRPVRGPVGTNVQYEGVCGTRTYRDGRPLADIGAVLSTDYDLFFVTQVEGGSNGVFDIGPNPEGRFSGAFTVPATALGSGSPLALGLHYVTGFCCIADSCRAATGEYEYPGDLQFVQTFCVSDADTPCDTWGFWLGGPLGAAAFSAEQWIDQIGAQFAPPDLPQAPAPAPSSSPSPSPSPPPTTGKGTATTQPPASSTSTSSTTKCEKPKPDYCGK